MLFAPVVAKAFQDTVKRSETKLDRYCDCMKAEINGRKIHLSPVEMMTGDLENKNLNTIIQEKQAQNMKHDKKVDQFAPPPLRA